eukprot:SRR837773.1671.p2 GENE.SRR837773.1671~~SRR837773.1671.p2  ORF type:complete len:220 (-),score=100.07 SRR837773.1671:112-672(-)
MSGVAPGSQYVQYVQEPYIPQGQQVMYVDEAGNPIDINQLQGPVEYVDEAGNPIQMDPYGGVQYVDENGNPVQFVDEYGNPVADPNAGMYGAPQAPSVFNVSPEIFAKLASGGQLTPEEMAALSGAPPAPVAAPALSSAGVADGARDAGVTSATDKKSKKDKKSSEKSSKKKKALGSKKKSKGVCC